MEKHAEELVKLWRALGYAEQVLMRLQAMLDLGVDKIDALECMLIAEAACLAAFAECFALRVIHELRDRQEQAGR